MKIKLLAIVAIILLLVNTFTLPAMAVVESTVTASVTVTEFISVTIEDSDPTGIHFGSLAPGTSNNLDTDADANTPSITATVDQGSNANVDLQIKGEDFSATFTVDNAKYSSTYNGTKTGLSTSYVTFASNKEAGESEKLWHWLDVPSGVAAGDYSSSFSYKAIAHVSE